MKITQILLFLLTVIISIMSLYQAQHYGITTRTLSFVILPLFLFSNVAISIYMFWSKKSDSPFHWFIIFSSVLLLVLFIYIIKIDMDHAFRGVGGALRGLF